MKFEANAVCCIGITACSFQIQVRTLAKELYDQHFRAAQAKPRGVVAKLCSIVERLEKACEKHSSVIMVSIGAIIVIVLYNAADVRSIVLTLLLADQIL